MDFNFTASSDGEDLIEGEDNMKKAQIIDDWCHQYLHPPYDDVPNCLATSIAPAAGSAVCCLLSLCLSLLWVKIEIRSEMQKSRKFAFFFFFFFFFSSFVDEKK
jgi:hypothetical protein